jgi:uncharacterized membrane protein YdjX (TVP38/TMEM64 family)
MVNLYIPLLVSFIASLGCLAGEMAPFLIFLFGLTPLSDDVLMVPLGLIRYSAKKTILFCWLGKFCMMMIFAYNLLNICNLIGGESWLLSIITLYILILMIYLFLRIDFLKIRKKEKTSEG